LQSLPNLLRVVKLPAWNTSIKLVTGGPAVMAKEKSEPGAVSKEAGHPIMKLQISHYLQRPASLFIVLALVFQFSLTACSPGQETGPIIIKFPHVTAPGTPKGQGAERMRQLVDERLGGRVKVEVYPSSQLMNDDDSLEALAFGEIQMIAVSLSKFDRLTPKFQVFDLPFLFTDLDAVEAFQDSETGQKLLHAIEDKGFLGLGFWHNGMKQISGPVPLRTPKDAAGLKFRIMVSDVLQAQIQAIDAVPQKMAFGEVYQALQSGAIDAQENTWSNIWSQKFFEVQPFVTESNHGYLGYFLAVNPEFWNGLPDDIRTEMESIVAEVNAEVNARAHSINLEDRDRILETGRSSLVELSPVELVSWREVMRPVWEQFADEIGEDIMQATPAGQGQ
jgi:C4-dicarboxylate-binding protein DctP